VAHSDGDVIYHSVVDAILGALSLPDIGQLFPDNDPRLKGSNSEVRGGLYHHGQGWCQRTGWVGCGRVLRCA
jgi:2-C-methyl-D-erythritol 2,4-cyclodiphosphate synthase